MHIKLQSIMSGFGKVGKNMRKYILNKIQEKFLRKNLILRLKIEFFEFLSLFLRL